MDNLGTKRILQLVDDPVVDTIFSNGTLWREHVLVLGDEKDIEEVQLGKWKYLVKKLFPHDCEGENC